MLNWWLPGCNTASTIYTMYLKNGLTNSLHVQSQQDLNYLLFIIHWRCSHYAATHARNKKVTMKGGHPML